MFQSFFEIESLEMPPVYGSPVEFHGIFEDNDPSGRLIANRELQQRHRRVLGVFHTLGADRSVERAYKFGVNYLMYALTH